MSISTSSTVSLSFSANTESAYDYDIWGANYNEVPEVATKAINTYEYLIAQANGNMEVSNGVGTGEAVVDIYITFNLTTPSNKSLTFEFNPLDLQGEGLKQVKVILGPNELEQEVGTFYLRITISVIVTLLSTEVLNIDLTPVDLEFEIPA